MKYRWELLLWLWLAFFFHQADRQVFNVILPVLGKELSLSGVQLGMVGSVFIAANALMVPIAGFLGDAYSRKRIVVVSLFAWSLATLKRFRVRCRPSRFDTPPPAGEAFYFPSAVAMLSVELLLASRCRALSLFQTSVCVDW